MPLPAVYSNGASFVSLMNDLPSDPQRILETLSKARAQIQKLKQPKDQRIAIVGMAGRFPGAESVNEFWELLRKGESGIRDLSEQELEVAGVARELYEREEYIRRYASFEDPTAFDAAFFGYSPGEADVLDPQHRVFLECAWAAMEDAGYDAQQIEDRVGVYAGAALNSYLVHLHSDAEIREDINQVQAVVSNVMGLMPTRVSYHLDLKGPSCGIQTGCSTSLVAVHQACRSLLDGECDMALAGGVTIGMPTPEGYLFEPGGIASPDGRCRAFDVEGKGTVFGNGVGVVVLKRLSEALEDGDCIRAVVLGSAVNNDGADKVGLLAPSVAGQAEAIERAILRADISPETISYIEAHGTATELGDPVEFAALDQALGATLDKARARCAMGSVKSNVGHLDAAAGIAGLMKTVLSMRHRELPASLNFAQANLQIDLENRPFYVNAKHVPWPEAQGPRRAGVSSFGMGGTNAHVILEQAPAMEELAAEDDQWQILPISAKTESALVARRHQLGSELAKSSVRLADIAFTLQAGRRAMRYRQAIVCRNTDEAIEQLEQLDTTNMRLVDEASPVVFLFSGQGSQYAGMARGLYESEPVFRAAFNDCAAILKPELDLVDLVYGGGKEALRETANAQPALFAVEYAMAKFVMNRGVKPSALLGHSLGEYVAVCLAGVLTLEDALHLVRFRGEIMQGCPPGSMLALRGNPKDVERLLEGGLEIATINAPGQTVVSGTVEAITRLKERLAERDIASQVLETSHAFHSSMMESALPAFRERLSGLSLQAPRLDVISNRTGTWLTAEQATSVEYWVEHLRHTVRFAEGLETLRALSGAVFVEVGPGQALARFAEAQLGAGYATVSTLPGAISQMSETETLARATAELWLQGVRLAWRHVHGQQTPRRVPLPVYPFERTPHFVALKTSSTLPTVSVEDAKLPEVEDWFYVPTWRSQPAVKMSTDKSATAIVVLGHPDQRDQLTQALAADDVIWVEAGAEWAQTETGFTVNPVSKADFGRLIDAIGKAPDRWIHAWSFTKEPGHDVFDSLVALSQSLTSPARLEVLVSNSANVTGSEAVILDRSALLGLVNVLPQEVPGLECRLLEGGPASAPFVRHLDRELGTPFQKAHAYIAYRGKRRWVHDYEAISLPDTEPTCLAPRAIYLIVGDLVDGLGLVYARALRKNLDAKVMLIGREGLPEPSDWDNWLATHGNQHPVTQLIQQLKALGREGEDIVMTSARIADPSSLKEALAALIERLGAGDSVQGVFYADVMGGEASSALSEVTKEDKERIYEHKVNVIRSLEDVLADREVSFVVLQSSLSSVVGGRGFAAYAAANAYLDAFASACDSLPVVSINWDACQLGESEVVGESSLMAAALSPDEVWETTKRVLGNPHLSQVVVSPRPLEPRLQALPSPEDLVSSSERSRPELETAYVAPSTPVEQAVAKAMGELLGVAKIGAHDDFFALGGHSLLAIQAITKLRKKFQVEVPMRAILQGTPTVAGIAQVIEENMSSLSEDDASVVEDLLGKIEDEKF